MLRSGYSSETVQRELSVRRLAEPCDAVAEKTLREAGAASALIVDHFKGDLVAWKNGRLVRFDDEGLATKTLVALYFSAHWCAPCRKFTPQLVEFYNRVASQHPEF